MPSQATPSTTAAMPTPTGKHSIRGCFKGIVTLYFLDACSSDEYSCAGLCVPFAYTCDGVADCVVNGMPFDELEMLCGGNSAT